MGICQSAEQNESRKRNAEIENQLKKEKLEQKTEVKMLLLGK